MTATAAYPYDCVCYVLATFPDGSTAQGSGAIVGGHTVLTASHVLWDATTGQAATSVEVFAGYNLGGSQLTGQYVFHYNPVDDANDRLSQSASQSDFAVIDFASSLSSYGSFSLEAGYSGGTVHVTGYPASAFGAQIDQVGTVSLDPWYSVLDYGTIAPTPGNSGGPLWIDAGTALSPDPEVVGIVSTTGWAVQLTNSDISEIDSWESTDSYLWGGASSQLAASQSTPAITGTAANDTIVGWNGADTLFGGAGNDSIVGGAAFNQINGNTGDDTIVGNSATGDWLLGGQGNDSISAAGSTGHNIINGNLGDDTIQGGSGGDTLRGGQGNDLIVGGTGNDWISGDLGDNTLTGGGGADTFHAGAGHDVVTDFSLAQGDHVLVDHGVSYVTSQVGADVHIDFSNGGEMVLQNTQLSSLQTANGWIITS